VADAHDRGQEIGKALQFGAHAAASDTAHTVRIEAKNVADPHEGHEARFWIEAVNPDQGIQAILFALARCRGLAEQVLVCEGLGLGRQVPDHAKEHAPGQLRLDRVVWIARLEVDDGASGVR